MVVEEEEETLVVAPAAPAGAAAAPVGRRMWWWLWKRLRRTGLAAVPEGARDDITIFGMVEKGRMSHSPL